MPRSNGGFPGREEASCHPEVDDIFQVGGCKFECLLNVVFSQLQVFAKKLFSVWIKRICLDDAAHADADTTDAWLAINLLRVHGDGAKIDCGHYAFVDRGFLGPILLFLQASVTLGTGIESERPRLEATTAPPPSSSSPCPKLTSARPSPEHHKVPPFPKNP